ncbi:MAG: ATP-binding protein [Bacillota bacterium]
MVTQRAARACGGSPAWDAMKLMARDLGFNLVEVGGRWRPAPGRLSLTGRRKAAPARVAPEDLARLQVENDWLLRTCRDYVGALARAGTVLGLSGWVVLSESSGVLLEVFPLTPVQGEALRLLPEPGLIISLAAAGVNPVGLALDQVGTVLIGNDGGVSPEARGVSLFHGLGVPLGDSAVPVGCLGVLLPPRPQPATEALLGQALFSARAIDLAAALRRERAAHLQIAAGLAHEIRNPLTAVKGFLELTLAHRSEVPEYAGVALRELDRAISLLEDYSLLSRAPRIQPSQPVSVTAVLSEAALVARGLAAAGPAVTIDYADSEPGLVILADPPRLKQVLLNLCRNAVEAMPGGGVLTLRARCGTSEVVIEVVDTGLGVPPSDLDRIFEPFYTTKETGTGLGLAVCRRIVEAHGGRIAVESRPGQGTTFRVHLPRSLQVLDGRGG